MKGKWTLSLVMLMSMMMVLAGCKDQKRGGYSSDGDDEEQQEMTSEANEKLLDVVETSSRLCPIDLGQTGEVTDITYENGAVVYYYSLNEDFVDIEALAENRQKMKQSMLAMVSNPSTSMRTLAEMVIEADSKLKFVVKGKESGIKASVTLRPTELEEALNTDISPVDRLQAAIETTNLQMPMTIEEGLTMKKLLLIGNNVTYKAEVDESMGIDMTLMYQNKAAVKQSIMDNIKQMGPVERSFLEMVVDAGKNLSYSYRGNRTGKTLDIVVTNGELKNILNY